MDAAAARCEWTPPTTHEPDKHGFHFEAASPILRPLSHPTDVDNKSHLSTSINVASAHAIAHDPNIVCSQPVRASVEDGNEKLLGRKRRRGTLPDQNPVMHTVGLPGNGSSADRHLITPPPSSTSAQCRPVKVRRTTTRKQEQHRRRRLSDEEKKMLKTLPEGMRHFTEREMCWSKAAADTDFMLALPRSNQIYVDGKQRLTFNDSRFSVPVTRRNDATRLVSAGIPSQKPYAPFPSPDSSKLTLLGLPKDLASHEITNDAIQEEAFHARPSVKLIIPDVIKALLVDDWENVTKNTQLVPLPHPKPVTKILEDYSAYEMPKRPADSSHADILEETLSGLKEYFDKSLGRILLYKYVSSIAVALFTH